MENSYGKGAIIFNPASIVYILRSAGMSEEEANKHSNDFITSKGTKIPDLDDIGARLELDNNIPTKKVTDALFKFARLGETLTATFKNEDGKYDTYSGIAQQAQGGVHDAFFSILTQEERYVNIRRGTKVTRGNASFIL